MYISRSRDIYFVHIVEPLVLYYSGVSDSSLFICIYSTFLLHTHRNFYNMAFFPRQKEMNISEGLPMR